MSGKEIRLVYNWLLLFHDHSSVFLPQKIQFQRKWSATSVEKRTQMRNAGTLTAAHTATACRVRLSAPLSAAHLCLVLNPSTWREAAVPCVQVMRCDNPVYCDAGFLGPIIRFLNWVLNVSACLNSITKTTDFYTSGKLIFLTDRHIVQKYSLSFTYSENCELKKYLLAPVLSFHKAMEIC